MSFKHLLIATCTAALLMAACDDSSGACSDENDTAGTPVGKADQPGANDDDPLARATVEVGQTLEEAGSVTQFNYCAHDAIDEDGEPTIGALKCRSLFLFENSDMFRISFFDGSKLSGASEYALPNLAKGDRTTYRLYVDKTLDGTPDVAELVPENQDVEVEFDDDGFPTIVNMTLHLSPTLRLEADLSFGADVATLEGLLINDEAGTSTELALAYERVG